MNVTIDQIVFIFIICMGSGAALFGIGVFFGAGLMRQRREIDRVTAELLGYLGDGAFARSGGPTDLPPAIEQMRVHRAHGPDRAPDRDEAGELGDAALAASLRDAGHSNFEA